MNADEKKGEKDIDYVRGANFKLFRMEEVNLREEGNYCRILCDRIEDVEYVF